ncbi:ATP-binding protein [Streptomyces sp. NPDC021356]|uniref:sensor histidine kinase n=1 Tax=Streptomyces sp. NPDC021356 TaxID=3154900 RepID=UPI0033D48F1C
MENVRNWLLPALLAVGEVLWLGTGAAWAAEAVPGPAGTVGVLCGLTVQTVALGHRRRTPVGALTWTAAASVLGQMSWPDGYLGIGTLVALYSLAVHCQASVTLRAVAAVIGVEWLLSLARVGPRPELVLEMALETIVYALCAGLGEGRRQWLAGRLTAARRLAAAEDGRRRAAETERERLARELHDVSAHHLTSVVVTVDAARRLGDSRRGLRADALAFAERTGTETLTALRWLVGLLQDADRTEPSQPMTARIEALVADFGRLGRPISTEIPPDLAGRAAEAAWGIVREALTNALRHAPGTAVRVRLRRTGGQLVLTVANTAPRATTAPHPATALGSGRGLDGMRRRAAAVGGQLTASPDPDGGWQVRATLPDDTGPRPATVPRPRRRRDALRGQRLSEAALTATAAALPLFVALADMENWTGAGHRAGISGLAVLAMLTTAHALPLLWRRRAPRAGLVGVLAAAWLWPPAVACSLLPAPMAQFLAAGLITEALAAHAVAVYGPAPVSTWPLPLVASTASAVVLPVTAGADGTLGGLPASWTSTLVMAAVTWALLTPTFVLLWTAGLAVRRRRLRVLAREHHALASSAWQAGVAADAERRRLAAKLREAVLDRTALVAELARLGRLDDIADAARSALAAMRELLHSLDGADNPSQRFAPSPTTADLGSLCHGLRAAGRDVRLRGLADTASELPPPLALLAYRIVASALDAGDPGPARVTLRRRRGTLHITVSGVPLAVTGPVAERLRVQADAGEGRITFAATGTVRISLPASPHRPPAQEVPPSPHT